MVLVAAVLIRAMTHRPAEHETGIAQVSGRQVVLAQHTGGEGAMEHLHWIWYLTGPAVAATAYLVGFHYSTSPLDRPLAIGVAVVALLAWHLCHPYKYDRFYRRLVLRWRAGRQVHHGQPLPVLRSRTGPSRGRLVRDARALRWLVDCLHARPHAGGE